VLEKNRRVETLQANSYRTVTETIVKTDTDLNYEEYDRITFQKYPQNDVNVQDFSFVMSAIKKPRLEQGSKYRKKDICTWEIRLS